MEIIIKLLINLQEWSNLFGECSQNALLSKIPTN